MRMYGTLFVVGAWLAAGIAAAACSAASGGGGAGDGDAAVHGGSSSGTGGGSSGAASSGSGGGSGGSSGGSGGSSGGSGGSSGGSGGSSGAGSSSGGGSGGSSSGSGGSSGSSSGSSSGGATIPLCQMQCSTAADCATAGVAIYSASHYACTGGWCQYLGCQSDAECASTFQKPNYGCGTYPGLSYKTCVETCSAPADCATAGVALYSASHYACTGGYCAYQGCQNDGECQSAMGKTNYACRTLEGATYATCVETCSAPADCATASVPLYSASHYACTGGVCDYLGCQNDAECSSAFQKANYACH